MADLLQVSGAVELGGLEEFFGYVFDEVAQDKDTRDLTADGGHQHQCPEVIDQAHAAQQIEECDQRGHGAGQEHGGHDQVEDDVLAREVIAGDGIGTHEHDAQGDTGAEEGDEDGVTNVAADGVPADGPVVPIPGGDGIEEPGVGQELFVALEAHYDHHVEREEGEGEDKGQVAELDRFTDFVLSLWSHWGKSVKSLLFDLHVFLVNDGQQQDDDEEHHAQRTGVAEATFGEGGAKHIEPRHHALAAGPTVGAEQD